MNISSTINLQSPLISQNQNKNQKNMMQPKMNRITESPVKVSISNEGLERSSSLQQNKEETYESMMQRREMLKKTRVMSYGYDLSMKAVEFNDAASENGAKTLSVTDRANGYISAYASMYDEIVRGYENGTREIYVEDEFGMHRLTKEEELKALEEAYKREVDDFVTMEKANEQAYAIVSQEMIKIASVSARSGVAVSEANDSKAMEQHKVPENLNGKMLSAADIFKQNYAAFNPDTDSLSQVLSRVKIS
ncbi:hypothetical protein C804_03818 [Lachnospiraceae bacterium A4]|nr:hypothetical protein C804_03818 [Lachnospiraceae bacterium A4]